MSKASRHAGGQATSRIDRLQPWIAALASALLHLWFAYLLLTSQPIVMTTPQGASAGSRMVVDFVGITPSQPVVAPVARPAPATPPAQSAPAASRVRTTRVEQAEAPVPPEAPDPADALTEVRPPQPAQQPSDVPPVPVQSPADAGQGAAQTAASPPSQQRRQHVWGQPPGMLPEETAPVNSGLSRSPSVGRGRGRDASSDLPSLEVGGYQVIYDTTSETRLREWRDQGVSELFIPLPGTRRLMVCPLETALRRESSDCRMVDPEDPQMRGIGDAREVIGFHRVYRQGEVVWRGPGPYR
ncbi:MULTISPECIES: plasmid stabilization protein ParE [Luteimonas]|uniref:Plasmid stabilization protein ParE n=1 Tax=Luteimonas chenhongjianii TaxID=2006110 RepID=A0A290XBM9_9GAMM|nr:MULTISPECIES: plasmid stabilization protein ParE [Luteimonas]ATD66555.1 plasmid stabilization protein ParE [Luteimonas chenhongjianii]RPD85211.1 type II toxin-antitoxin system RelE/ParE family toxin [Luteimonas sp. 100069]